jgi:predicted alpha/beta-hydrolase family hydrolase
MNLDQIAGVAHQPDAGARAGHQQALKSAPKGVVVLTHGAGGSRDSPLLQQVCDEWARHGWLAVRYNLPYRRRRPKGPPSGSAASDRAGIVEAIELCRGLADGPLIAGGHSYGGRQTSMVVAAHEASVVKVDVLTLFSYPVHPPGKPERPRTEHLPDITVPTVFTHGTSDPFGTPEELRAAAALIPAPTVVVEITGARHDLGSKTLDVAGLAVTAAIGLI